MSVMSVSPWRGIAEHLAQVADSLESSSASLDEAGKLGGKVRHSWGDGDAPSYLKFQSAIDRDRWRELLQSGGTELGVAHAGARMLERQLRSVDLPTGDLGMPAAMIHDLSAAVGYAESMNTARSRWVEAIQDVRAEPDVAHGMRSRPGIAFGNSSFLEYQWATSGGLRASESVRALARVAAGLAEPADSSAIVRAHLDRGSQLANEDALTPLSAYSRQGGVKDALDVRMRSTPMVQAILDAGTQPDTALSTATRDSLLATASHRLDEADRNGTAHAGAVLDALRDVAALSNQSKEFADALGPVLVSAERATIEDVMRMMPARPSSPFNEGRDMFGIEPISKVQGLTAEATSNLQDVRSALAGLQRGVPELISAIRAETPTVATLSFEDEFAVRLAASREAVPLEA